MNRLKSACESAIAIIVARVIVMTAHISRLIIEIGVKRVFYGLTSMCPKKLAVGCVKIKEWIS